MNEQEFAELSAAYALGALDADDARAFETARQMHPEWQAQAARDAETAAFLADSVPEVEPPTHVRDDLLSFIALTAQTAPVPLGAPRPPSTGAVQTQARMRWSRGILAMAASFVILVGIGFTAVSIHDQVNLPPAVVALNEVRSAPDARFARAPIDGGGVSTVYWSESVGEAVIVSDGLPKIASDQSFELWFVRDGVPIAAGAFEPDGGNKGLWVMEGQMQPGDTVAITIEPLGGSPDGTPTGPRVVAIPT